MDIPVRVCKKCQVEKSLSEFRDRKTARDGKTITCKRCMNKQCRDLRNAKKRAANAAVREARGQGMALDQPAIEAIKKDAIEKFIQNKPVKDVRKSPQWKRATSLRSQLRSLVRGFSNSKSLQELVGTDHEGLKTYLESLFKPGMSWENYGRHGWHIDHKKPCSAFDLTDDTQARECFHFKNLQPLWATENWSKGFSFNK